jgi:hypothetical protein
MCLSTDQFTRVPSHVSKSQLLRLKKSSKYGKLSLKSDLGYFMQEYIQDLCWDLGLVFCSTQTSTQVPHLTSKKCCHVGIYVILGTQDLRLSVKWQGPTSMLSTAKIARIGLTWLGTPCEQAPIRLLILIRHLFFSGMWFIVAPRMDIKKRRVLKSLDYVPNDNHYSFNSQHELGCHRGGGLRPLWPYN